MTTLTAHQRADLAGLPVPLENAAPVAACVVAAPGGWRLAWAMDGGRRKETFGDPYHDPLAASAAAAFLNGRIFGPAS